MKVYRGVSGLKDKFNSPAVTLGNFDGVHLGHRKIFERLIENAAQMNGESLVLTFEPHPVKVLRPEMSPKIITPISEKLKLIEECKIDGVILADFTKEFAAQHPEQFVYSLLHETLAAKLVMVGHDFTFGKRKEGTTKSLEALGKTYGFDVEIVKPLRMDGEIVSSTRIRKLLLEGALSEANRLLGRCHSVSGKVVKGHGRGRTLGFPTANIEVEGELIPGNGVYAAVIQIGSEKKAGIANIGVKPTFKDEERSVEAHIFDFGKSLYGETVSLHLVEKIRDERPFDSPGELAGQIERDIVDAKKRLKREGY